MNEQREYEAQMRLDKLVLEEWRKLAEDCPWQTGLDMCMASDGVYTCDINNCAPWHFRR